MQVAEWHRSPKDSGWQKSTAGDLRRRIFTSRWIRSSIPVFGWRP